MSEPTYPMSKEDLYALMGATLQARIATQISEASAAIVNAATNGLGKVEYTSAETITQYVVGGIWERFPGCSIMYTSGSSLLIEWA